MKNRDISQGVTIDTPPVTILWGVDEEKCKQLIASHEMTEDTSDGFTTFMLPHVTYLGVQDLVAVFRFDLSPGNLKVIEFQHGGENFQEKFEEVNNALKNFFGAEEGTAMDENSGFSGLTWNVHGVKVSSYIWASAGGEIAMLTLEK